MVRKLLVCSLIVLLGAQAAPLGAAPAGEQTPGASPAAQVRTFRFIYAGAVNQLPPQTVARVWLPLATTNFEQKVEREKVVLPAKFSETREEKYGNRVLYFEAMANADGEIPLDITYRVERRELLAPPAEKVAPAESQLFLAATKLEPNDGSLTTQVFGQRRPMGERLAVARQLYAAVNGRMKYDKPAGQPWGRGDARWACDAKYGNCTDFHSLFISLCRNLKIPAKFEIGFSVPSARGAGEITGYHCWAKFEADGKWVPVDISEANKEPKLAEYYFGNLTADRVALSTGRDLALQPAPAAGTVNFLVYPYVEVAGKPYTNFVKKFRYEDVK